MKIKEEPPSTMDGIEITKSKGVHPLLLRFQNRFGLEETEQTRECALFKEKGCPLTAAIVSGKQLYTGQEVSDSYVDNYLLIRSKNGDIRLVQVNNARLKASLKEESTSLPINEFELKEKFGSKRTKRGIEQSKKMKVDVDTVKEKLENSAMQMKVDIDDITDSVAKAESSIFTYTPPINREAKDPRLVYKLSDMLTDAQLDSLKTTAITLLEEDTYDVELSEYITELIGGLRNSPRADKILACQTLLYADNILRYSLENYRKVLTVKYKVCLYSELVNTLVIDTFSSSNEKGRTRPPAMKDKAVCYVIVLLLLAFNLEIPDSEKLRKALNVPIAKLSNFIKIVGARMSTGVEGSKIILKLPLVSPPSLNARRGRKQ